MAIKMAPTTATIIQTQKGIPLLGLLVLPALTDEDNGELLGVGETRGLEVIDGVTAGGEIVVGVVARGTEGVDEGEARGLWTDDGVGMTGVASEGESTEEGDEVDEIGGVVLGEGAEVGELGVN